MYALYIPMGLLINNILFIYITFGHFGQLLFRICIT